MQKTIFRIEKMDCPSEENLIRMKLDEIAAIKALDFDIPNRKLSVFHESHLDSIESALNKLNLGSTIIESNVVEDFEVDVVSNQRKTLWIILIINFSFFLIEMTTGLISRSMGLVADSLDMLADSLVYGISLFAVGGSVLRKNKIAKVAGYFQLILAMIGFVEVIRRFFNNEQIPDFTIMIIVSVFALIANGLCLVLLQRSSGKDEAHMKASLIFTSNDVIINLGVIIAGILVFMFNSQWPDLIIGTIVFLLVMQGARRIIALGN